MHKLMRETHGNFKLLSKDITLYVHRVSPESVPGFPRRGIYILGAVLLFNPYL